MTEASEDQQGLASSRIWYNEDRQIAICVACEQCVVPNDGVRRHLKDQHRDWPLALRKDVVTYCAGLSLLKPEEVQHPPEVEQPIEGLALDQGWKCKACEYCCISEDNMTEHNKLRHKWTKRKGRQWRAACVQTMFGGPRRRYFEVAGPERPHKAGTGDFDDAIERLLDEGKKRDREEQKSVAQTGDEQLPTDNTPWMRKTRWARKFAGRDLLAVAAFCRKPDKDEGSLLLVWQSVHRVLERCRASIAAWHDDEEDGDVILGWLSSPQSDQYNPEPFSTYYEKSTHVKYTNWWAHGICYCLRLVLLEDRHGHTFSDEEEEALRRVWDVAELGAGDESVLDSSVFDLSVLFWTHEGRAHSKSAIIHISAVFGIDNHKGCYRLPPIHGQILAALLYCARLLLFEHALPAAERQHLEDPFKCFLEIHHRWLVDGRPTPFHYVDNLLAYALGAGKEVGGKPRVQWSKDRQTLIYQGQRLPLTDLRRFVNELCGFAESILRERLLFSADSGEHEQVDVKQLVDDLNETSAGYSFVSDLRNHLDGGRERMTKRLASSSEAESLLQIRGGNVEVQPEAWRKYRLHPQQFLATLFLLIHTDGVPARGVEILPIRCENAPEAPRNVFVHDGQVMIVTAYHKSQAITGQHKVIARFLGRRVGRLLIAFLTEVRPFVTLLDRDRVPPFARCFLWADEKGIWKTPRATQALVQESAARLGCRITIQDYRHMAKAIDREHVRGLAGDVEEDADLAHDLAAAHTPQTADAVYGIDASMLRSLSARTLLAFRTVSDRWHQFWRVDGAKPKVRKAHIRARSDTAEPPISKRKRPPSNPPDELLIGLSDLLGSGAQFRSPTQQEAVTAVWKGEGPLVVVLPPAGGKSLIFQLPASLAAAATTIVVLPFRALTKDLFKRCRALGLSSGIWTGLHQQSKRIIFVGAETAAINDDFLTFASELQTQGKLDRIVVDEAHVPLTSASYRSALVHLDRLRSIPCPLVLLTGTLPPLLQTDLETTYLLGNADQGLRYIRASTNRPNVEYTVEVSDESRLEERVVERMRNVRKEFEPGQRAVVFCRSRSVCDRLAEQLGCQLYHRTFEAKEESLDSWIDGSEKVMIATSALGTGVDIDGIRLVVHLSRPHGIMDFVQEVGRAGRSGDIVRSPVLLGRREFQWLQSEGACEREWNREGLRLLLTERRCRRKRLSAIMDGESVECGDRGGRPCDLCQDPSRLRVDVVTKTRTPRAERQEKRYAVGPQLWQARVRDHAEQRQLVEWAVGQIGATCAACWLLRRTDGQHRPEACDILAAVTNGDYWAMRRSVQFETDCRSCFRCALPGDWCPYYSQSERCSQADIVTPILLAGWTSEVTRPQLESEVGGTTVPHLVTWMGRATRLGHTKASNGLRAAENIIRRLRPIESSLVYESLRS